MNRLRLLYHVDEEFFTQRRKGGTRRKETEGFSLFAPLREKFLLEVVDLDQGAKVVCPPSQIGVEKVNSSKSSLAMLHRNGVILPVT
jgi:hypothetical protein